MRAAAQNLSQTGENSVKKNKQACVPKSQKHAAHPSSWMNGRVLPFSLADRYSKTTFEELLFVVVLGFLRGCLVGGRRYCLLKGLGHFRCRNFAQQDRLESNVFAIHGRGGIRVLLDDRAFQGQAGKGALGA